MEPLAWSMILLIAAFALIVLELFVPSAGVLSILAAVALVASIVVAFFGGLGTGLLMLVVATVLVPAVCLAAVRWWPQTPIGQLILLPRPEDPDDVLPETEEYRGLKHLVGQMGVTKSVMMPSGAISIAGRTYDAVADGMSIDAQQTIQVVAVRTNRLIVRPVTSPTNEPGDTPTASPQDVLSQPVDAFGLDGFNEPLT